MKPEAAWIEHLMELALAEAELALSQCEVPVGAVIADLRSQEILASAHNQMEHSKDATAHAEVLALRQASQQRGNWRLDGCVLCVTLEPCTMCAGAIELCRLPLVVFGAADIRAGAMGSLYDLASENSVRKRTRVISGVLEDRSRDLLREFFEARRLRSSEIHLGEMAEWLKALDSKSSIGE